MKFNQCGNLYFSNNILHKNYRFNQWHSNMDWPSRMDSGGPLTRLQLTTTHYNSHYNQAFNYVYFSIA